MSVCRKHRKQGRSSCSCRVTSSIQSDGYGGPDVADVAASIFLTMTSGDSTPSSSSSSYDSGPSSSSSSSSSYDSGSSSSSSSDSSW